MWAAFRVFDTNGDGVITKDELAKILKANSGIELGLTCLRGGWF